MAVEVIWIIAAVGALVAGAVGFLLGRARQDQQPLRIAEARIRDLEEEAGANRSEKERLQTELAVYRAQVESHFDRTATLFVEMAGSYKQLFQHLSTDYEKLSDGTARDRFQARISALLLEDEAGQTNRTERAQLDTGPAGDSELQSAAAETVSAPDPALADGAPRT